MSSIFQVSMAVISSCLGSTLTEVVGNSGPGLPVKLELRELGKDYVRNVAGPKFDTPITVTFAPNLDDVIFVAEKGRSVIPSGQTICSSTTVILPGQVRVVRDGVASGVLLVLNGPNFYPLNHTGLVGLAMHPDYVHNGRFFVSWVSSVVDPVGCSFTSSVVKVQEYTATAALRPELGSTFTRDIIEYPLQAGASTHGGGRLEFAPQPPIADGALYIGTGDGTTFANGQDTTTLTGGVLRLDVDAAAPHYAPSLWGNALWARGLRHPVGMNFDNQSGDLWIVDTGGHCAEEVNRVPWSLLSSGQSDINFGWDIMEGNNNRCGDPPGCVPIAAAPPQPHRAPYFAYGHPACGVCDAAIAGGRVYHGFDIPELDGQFFFGDYCAGSVWSMQSSALMHTWQTGVCAGGIQPEPSLYEYGGGQAPLRPYCSATKGDFAGIGEDSLGELYFMDLDTFPSNKAKLYRLIEKPISNAHVASGAVLGGALNASGFIPDLCAVGSTSIAANDVQFFARNTVDNTTGILVMSQGLLAAPTANGVCLERPHARFVNTPVTSHDNDQHMLRLDLTSAPGNLITPGSTWYFQFWMSDPNNPAGCLTNAVEVAFGA